MLGENSMAPSTTASHRGCSYEVVKGVASMKKQHSQAPTTVSDSSLLRRGQILVMGLRTNVSRALNSILQTVETMLGPRHTEYTRA